jgi:hypothetical protein
MNFINSTYQSGTNPLDTFGRIQPQSQSANGNIRLPGIDPDQRRVKMVSNRFRLVPDRRNRRAGPHFHHGQLRPVLLEPTQPILQPDFLVLGAARILGPIPEHHHVGAGQRLTMRTCRQWRHRFELFLIDDNPFSGGVPNIIAAWFAALEIMD